jgi:predicted esterase
MNLMRLTAFVTLVFLAAFHADAQDDVADVPSQDTTVAGQAKQRYFLIGDTTRNPPEAGFGLLLVLPGGDGSAEINPFIRRVYKKALPEGYLVAQLVAVPSKNPRQIVWPTATSKDPKQAFTTESFITAVVKEIKAKHKIDPKRLFTFSWSSGGPAAYAASVMRDSPIRGSFIAMSIFPKNLKPLTAAKGQKYYLYQSRQDQVTKFHFAEMAKTELTKAGASVELAEYEGPHGWSGDVYGNISAGIEWLEKFDPAK